MNGTKNCSRKVRTALRTKALNGEYVAPTAAYGYSKDPEDKHRLLPDDHAPIVQRMFQMALEGKSCCQIAKVLENEKIPTPRAYRIDESGEYVRNERVIHPYGWSKTSVYKMLSNPIYIGKLVSQRRTTRSFKDKRLVSRPEDEWIIVEGTHEPLVDQETFDTVQARIQVKQPVNRTTSENKFRGLMICGDCNHSLVFSAHNGDCSYFSCNLHRRYGKTICSAHFITLDQIEALVLDDIRAHASLAASDTDKYVEHLVCLSEREWNGEKASYQKEAAKCQRRVTELDAILKKLYEDRVFGVISDERYAALSADYEAESKKLKSRYSELRDLMDAFKKQSRDAKDFAELVGHYTDITALTEELLHTLIDKIVVHEKETVDGELVMRVDIYYRFIGRVGDTDGGSLKVTKKALNVKKNTKSDTPRKTGA